VAPRSEDPKLIIRVINFELVQPICPRYVNVTDRQADGQTTYDSNTSLALRATRGNELIPIHCKYDMLTNLLYFAVWNSLPNSVVKTGDDSIR